MKNRKLLFTVVVVLTMLVSMGCTQPVHESSRFDGEEALKHAVELTSPKYAGRLPGTEGNMLAAEYIATLFAEYNLEPFGDDSTYYQWYEQPSFAYPQPFAVEILKPDGSVEKSYEYRYDFIETNSDEGYSLDLRVNGTGCTVSTSSKSIMIKDSNGDTIAMVLGRAPTSGLGDNRAAMFIRTGRLQLHDYPAIYVTPEAFESITTYLSEGFFLKLSGEIEYPLVTVPNVVAHLPAKGAPIATLLLTAHVDHFGIDCTGEINSGAVDNASGVSVMLELARFLSQEPPALDIFFIAFNGEERGLLGAQHYQRTATIPPGAKVINIDTVGMKEYESTFLLYYGGKTLASELQAIYRTYDAKTIPGPSTRADHAPFGERGYEAVSIVQLNQDYFDNQYHTPNDTVSLLCASSLQQVGNVILDYLRQLTK